jgi:dethiobiotin synthetase
LLSGLFVTGTDTGVGKTLVSAGLMHRYRLQCPLRPLRYWKPIQTGTEKDDDTADVMRLGGCSQSEILSQGVRLPRPLSPHLAARLSGQSIAIDPLVDLVTNEPPSRWVVEGAGGALVPINDSELMADLMARLALPILVVSRTTLGTINHTLLTIEALRTRLLSVVGVVMVGPNNPENRRAIEAYGGVPVVGEMPNFEPVTPELLERWAANDLDPDRCLSPFLGRSL